MDDLNQTIELLLNGRVDATLNAEVTYFDYLKEHPDANIKIAALTNDASQVAFPVRKGDETATLREALNQAINELREDGTIAEISEKYFGTDLSQAPARTDLTKSQYSIKNLRNLLCLARGAEIFCLMSGRLPGKCTLRVSKFP